MTAGTSQGGRQRHHRHPTFDIVAGAAGSAALTGTLVPSSTETEIVAGSETLIITLTGDT
jgi:hypothetical protein